MVSMKPLYTVHQGRRYRLKFRNASDDIHPLHLHRHSFELTRIAGKPTSGVMKDVASYSPRSWEFRFPVERYADLPSTAAGKTTAGAL